MVSWRQWEHAHTRRYKKGDILDKQAEVPSNATYKLVPVVHIDSVGGMHSNNDIVSEPQYVEGYIPFVNAKRMI